MRIGIPAETRAGETRVAATPETVKKMLATGHIVMVENGAGSGASIPDSEFQAAGATLVNTADLYGKAEIVLKVKAPTAEELSRLPAKSVDWFTFTLSGRSGCRICQTGYHRVCDGKIAAHLACPGHGCALLAGQYRRLQGGDDRCQSVQAFYAYADDRSGHG